MQKVLSALGFIAILSACGPEPDFYTRQGTAIVTGGVEEITEMLMWNSLEFYALSLPRFIPEITYDSIMDMLSYAWIEWFPEPIECSHGSCAGLQQGNIAWVHWKGSIPDSALFHELIHMTMEIDFGIWDYRHEHKEFWDVEKPLKNMYRGLPINSPE